MIRIYKTKDYKEMSKLAAGFIKAQITLKPGCVLGLATGTSPIGIYENLVKANKAGDIDFSEVQTFNLDEYIGVDATDPNSYRYFMNHYLFDHVNIDKFNTHIEDGLAKDMAEECRRYEALIRSLGGIDLQLLGIGNNGHIGFNEPSKHFAKRTHTEKLTKSTIEANARLFESADQVPTKAVTMGIQTIMNARRILLVATGSAKAEAVRDSFFGDITPKVPASALQLHRDVTVVADAEALALCDLHDKMTVLE